ncbi:hypothetical protein SR41_16485 [Sphingomonas melonis]|uniref:Uncharacterized protein n=1 Tax=Sphingomonas melonis TaxID=152682 RepID=A0A0D1M5L6_9SPHN|nr:hypothetical protein SR41_16485 [Sphingomonas melonis]
MARKVGAHDAASHLGDLPLSTLPSLDGLWIRRGQSYRPSFPADATLLVGDAILRSASYVWLVCG